ICISGPVTWTGPVSRARRIVFSGASLRLVRELAGLRLVRILVCKLRHAPGVDLRLAPDHRSERTSRLAGRDAYGWTGRAGPPTTAPAGRPAARHSRRPPGPPRRGLAPAPPRRSCALNRPRLDRRRNRGTGREIGPRLPPDRQAGRKARIEGQENAPDNHHDARGSDDGVHARPDGPALMLPQALPLASVRRTQMPMAVARQLVFAAALVPRHEALPRSGRYQGQAFAAIRRETVEVSPRLDMLHGRADPKRFDVRGTRCSPLGRFRRRPDGHGQNLGPLL